MTAQAVLAAAAPGTEPAKARPVLSVRDLAVGYAAWPRDVIAVEGVSFDVAEGETFGIVGESGSGKSSVALTIPALLHLNRGTIAKGSVTVGGLDLGTASEAQLRAMRGRIVGTIFQQPLSSLNPVQPIGRQIQEGLLLHGTCDRRQAREKAVELLRKMLLPDPVGLLDRYPHELSGGMRQRVVIAIALANDPRLIVADEPTTALDVTVQAQVLELLRAQIRSRGLSCVFISHDIEVIRATADRVGVMYAGRLVEVGPAADVLARPLHPYTEGLMLAAPSLAGDTAPTPLLGSVPPIDQMPAGCRFADRCRRASPVCAEEPPLEAVGGGRAVACWHWGEPGTATRAPAVAAKRQEDAARPVVLEVENLTKVYRSGKGPFRAVDDVSFTLRQAESLGIVGESGSGKSTLARLVMRLIEPGAGRIRLKGEDMLALAGSALRRKRADLQIVFQNPTGALDPRQRIYESVASPLRVHAALGRAEERKRVEDLLRHVDLDPGLLARYPHQLSGGQKQRVSIARALATNPSLLVCDEPLSALDVSTQAHVMAVLIDLRRRFGMATIFISHDLSTVRTLCDKVAVMYLGRIVEFGDVESVLHRPQHPYTRELVAAAAHAGERAVRLAEIDLDPVKAQAGGCRFRVRCPIAVPACAEQDPPLLGEPHAVACHLAAPAGQRAAPA